MYLCLYRYEKRKLLVESLPAVAAATFVASVGGMFSSAFAARALGLSEGLRLACLPRQVT